MRVNYEELTDEIKIRYIIIHSTDNLEKELRKTFRDVAFTSYDIKDISGIFRLDIISLEQNNGGTLSIGEIQIFNMPYHSVREFEDSILVIDGILEVYKTYDSFKAKENREFLTELCNIEMKIREIYTILVRLQDVNLENSRVKILKEYQENEEVYKKRLMNEFFFIEFSDYKNIDRKRDAKLEDLLGKLRQVRKIKDIIDITIELSHSTLRLEERFNELSKVPELIGRLERFRNNIAHNRYISVNDIENFNKAKSIIDEIYDNFLIKLENKEI